jgi:hypothetical protein
MHDRKPIHEIHVKFRNSENAYKFKNLSTELRQVPTDAEIGQKRLRCRSEKRSRETPVTLPAVVKPQRAASATPWRRWLVGLASWHLARSARGEPPKRRNEILKMAY